MITNVTQLRVRYADTDKMQFVYNGKYLEYFEVGRCELLRTYGLPYSEIETEGYQLPLIETGLVYRNPAFYDELLDIEAKVTVLYSPKIHIEYEVRRHETGELLVTGFTDHVFILESTKKATRPPKFYIEKLAEFFPKK
ncbi:MAG: acyl-CoA thioesterase [Melioribacteraceae bacterium]|nr:acyl-CoA thioesterase [Melioribacteraceae bacterium]